MTKNMSKHPLIVVLGLDPEKHEMPVMLKHHVSKMAKDFPIVFWAKDDLNADTWKSIQELVEKTNFCPEEKETVSKIITQ